MRAHTTTGVALLTLLVLVTCGGPDEAPRADTKHDLHGLWAVDWARTVGGTADAADAVGSMAGRMEMEFSAETVRVRIHGKDKEAPWSVAERDGERWTLENGAKDLVLSWIDVDAFRIVPDSGADATGMKGWDGNPSSFRWSWLPAWVRASWC